MRKIYTALMTMCMFCILGNAHAQVIDCTTNVSPANGATNIDPYPGVTLTWNAVAGATSYDVYLSTKTPPKQFAGTTTGTSFKVPDLFYNTTYYWYVVPKTADLSATGCSANVSNFKTTAAPPAPANNDCSGAIFMSTTPSTGSTLGATQSLPASECGGYVGNANDDVWYQFTAPSTGVVTFTMEGTGSFDGVFEAYSGDCGSLTSLTCSDSSQMGGREQLTINTTAGTNYTFRVYGFYGTLSSRGEFKISSSTSTLPVSLVSFTGEKSGNKNLLKWTTSSEQKNAGFEIQYSANGSDFNKIGYVASKAANGNSASSLNYDFYDAANFNANAFYRLKQIDKDGRSTFSNVVFLKGDKNNRIALTNIYPNPAHGSISLTLDAPLADQVSVEVRDIAGKVVLHQPASLIIGENKLPINVSSLPGGSYFIKAISKNGEATSVSKFVKQ